MPPDQDQVHRSMINAGNDVATIPADLQPDRPEVDGIVINAASTSGLDGVVQQACDRGIVVVSFDNTWTICAG